MSAMTASERRQQIARLLSASQAPISATTLSQELGVSRQGVFDNLSRAEALLRNMEEKTGCVRRAKEARRAVSKILSCANILASNSDETVASLAAQIIEAAQKLEE